MDVPHQQPGNPGEWDFSGADLRGLQPVTQAFHFNFRANFTNCQFGDLAFHNATINSGGLDFSGSVIHGATDFRPGMIQGKLPVRFDTVTFKGAAEFQGGAYELQFYNCDFVNGLRLRGNVGAPF